MELALISIQQVAVLFLLILAGYLCVRFGILSNDSRKSFSNLLMYLIVPIMIIYSYMTEFNEEILENLWMALLLSCAAIGIGIAVTFLITLKHHDRSQPIMRFAMIFSNAAYMGFPLIQAMFGSEGLLYASVYLTVFNIVLWSFGYSMIADKTSGKEILHSIITAPMLYAVLAGLCIFLFQIPIPTVIRQSFSLISGMNTPLAMIITGMIIASSDIRAILRNQKIWRTLGVRMVLIPAVCIVIFYLFGLHGMVPHVVLLLEACPCAAITSIFAIQYDYDEEYAAGAVVLTTLISIVTLPLCALFLSLAM